MLALSRGTHEGPVTLTPGMAIVGACVAETVLATSAASPLRGVVTMQDTQGEVRDLMIADGARPGVWLDGSAEGVLEGVSISGNYGLGVLFERNREVGAIAISSGTTLAMSDVIVRNTLLPGCADTTCSGASGGHGVVSNDGASASMTRFVVERAPLCGIYLARDAQMDLSDGEVRGHAIGACVQVDGYDAERLTNRLVYVDNGINLQGTTLPVPEAGSEPIERTPP